MLRWTAGLAAVSLVALSGCQTGGGKLFGQLPDGSEVREFTLENAKGTRAVLIDYGATLTQMHVPDKNGELADVVLGFDDIDGYLKRSQYFGCIAGRVANRIAKGKFSLDGADYQLAINNGPNHLHGGDQGFDKVMWSGRERSVSDGSAVEFRYLSPDGEEGYPGRLDIRVLYTLTDDDVLRVEYEATCDAATPVNLTHHSYFNLGGHASGNILGHELLVDAGHYTPCDTTLVPTGEIAEVAGTPFDFTRSTVIGSRIEQVEGGYDLNYVLDGYVLDGRGLDGAGASEGRGAMFRAARLDDPASGRVMEIHTSEPGLQFYTGGGLNGMQGKGGAMYLQYGALCLETQHFPDSVNQPSFPPTILRPGETYRHVIEHRFACE